MTEQNRQPGSKTSEAIRSLGGRTLEFDPDDGWLEVEFGPGTSGEGENSLRSLLEGLLAEVSTSSASGAGPGVTVYVKANLAADRPAEALIGRARRMQTSPNVAYAEGELRTAGGKLCGTGSSMVRFEAAAKNS